jgi:predicted GNAT family acetyltransferase
MQRLEIEQDGHTGFLTYSVDDERRLRILHVEVPPSLQGRGLGGALVRKAFAYANGHSLKVEAVCTFAARYIARNPELHSTE